MKIKNIPIKTKFDFLDSLIEVLTHGPMGTRVHVISTKDKEFNGITIGKQTWSNEVEVSFNEQEIGKIEVKTDLDLHYK